MSIEEKLKEYDKALYGEYYRGVIIVEKDDLYGIINIDGEEILPCQFKNYFDVYREWQELGFPNKPIIMTQKQAEAQEFKNTLIKTHDDLLAQGNIKSITFDGNTIEGAELVTLANGDIGIAASVITSGPKKLEVKNIDGSHVKYITTEPGAYYTICSDENNLYVGTYNTFQGYIACYRMGNFEEVWKVNLPGSRIQSMAVNDNDLIAFDVENRQIKYFDKQTGIVKDGKSIKTNGWHQFLAATNERLLAGQPGFSLEALCEFDNELKVYDNDTKNLLSNKSVPIGIGDLNGVAIDKLNCRIFLVFDNKVGVIDESGYQGLFFTPTRDVQSLHFDQKTGCLMISMIESEGKVEIYSPKAIDTLIETSQQAKLNMGNTEKLQEKN